MSDLKPSKQEHFILIGIFCIACVVHFLCTTQNWRSGFMPGHEFRQAQTALVSYYIDKDNNFSPLYETPVLGKPWVSILLEVPFYEWSVVGLSRATGIKQVVAARTISLTCLYLTLPALFLLLGRFALSRPRRLLVLTLILTCPVYIFYSRAFLMESMELMCCGWFLLGFVRTMDERSWAWLALTIIAGTGASLIKSSTFAVWLLPGAGYGCWLLWQSVRKRKGWSATLQIAAWGAATVAIPLAALRWWINLTDPIKAAHASAWIFTSKNLSEGNWGLVNFGARFSYKVWRTLFDRWQDAIMAPWLIGVGLVLALVFSGAARWRVLGMAAVFFLAQIMFPFAYTYQDYYFYACAVFLLAAFGFALNALLDSSMPRWSCWLIIAVPIAAQFSNYWHRYHLAQLSISDGGFSYTRALNDIAPKDGVLVVAGADWGAIIPFYAQRKALMIRNGLEFDPVYLKRAFNDLDGENVCALVLVGPLRYNRPLLEQAAQKFDLDADAPTFSEGTTDVYFSEPYIDGVQNLLRGSNKYPGVIARAHDSQKPRPTFKVSPGVARSLLANVSPAPFKAHFTYGVGHIPIDGRDALSFHPDSDLWLHAPAGATVIKWDYEIFSGAYERPGDKTDGVDFIVTGETSDGHRRPIYHRLLDPVKKPGDRGLQQETIPYQPLPGETLVFSSRPNVTSAYDWAYTLKIEVK
ncbi:MAG: hypothetical protein ABI273_11075 [Lacunisphaera sp.]